MRKTIFIYLIFFTFDFAFGQTDSTQTRTKRFGVIGSFDYAYNFSDKVINPGLSRRWTVGLSFTNKKRQFIGIFAAGLKFFKFNLYSPSLKDPFLKDLKQNYSPINGDSEDSLIGAVMCVKNGEGFTGTAGGHLQVGIIVNNKFKPSFNFYFGEEVFTLYNNGFTKYEDPVHQDINYVGMGTLFYEFKLGCGLPLKLLSNKPYLINLNIGYKLTDYNSFKFNSTPLNAYTTGSLDKKYRFGSKLTVSISLAIWSNW